MTLICPKCGAPATGGATAGNAFAHTCSGCGSGLQGHLFRAFDSPVAAKGEMAMAGLPGDATCFFCEGEVASDECSSCGRFICERCKVDWAGAVTCLACVHAMREVKRDDRFVSGRLIYDNLALSMVLLPLVAIPIYGIVFATILAPFALYFVVRHWSSPRGIVPRGTARRWSALVLSSFLVLAVVVGIVAIVVSVS